MNIIDGLKQKRRKISDKKNALRAQVAPLNQKILELENEISDIDRKINDASREPIISDHALIRVLERMYDFDFEGVKKSIMTESVKRQIRAGVSRIKQDGATYVVKGSTIVTATYKGDKQ